MKLKIELTQDGNTISGRVLEQDESLRRTIDDWSFKLVISNTNFSILSGCHPELGESNLYVRGKNRNADDLIFGKSYDSLESADNAYKNIIELVNELNGVIGGVLNEQGLALYINSNGKVSIPTVFHDWSSPMTEGKDQSAKADAGKPNLTLVPTQIIRDIAEVREYGNRKYGSRDNWKNVELERYIAALYRHLLEMVEDPLSVDPESEIEHYKHIACNAAFICEMLKGEGKE